MNIFYTFKAFFVVIILSLVWLVFLQYQTYATEIRLGIYNSYQWSITIQPWENIVQLWWNIRTKENTLWIIIWANTWSSYTITGISPITTNIWSGMYQHNHNITLQSIDWPQTIYGLFLKDTEPYSTNMNIMIDRSAPSSAFLLQPISNTIISGDITLSRSPSIDNGIGLSHYKIHLSLDAWFLWETILISSGNSLSINKNDLPLWTLFWYVEALDYLWNKSISSPSFFHNQAFSTVDDNPSDGGWSGIPIIIDNNSSSSGDETTSNPNQTWNHIQSWHIWLQSGNIITDSFTWDNEIIIQPNDIQKIEDSISISSWNNIDNNIINENKEDNSIIDLPKKDNNWSSSHNNVYNYIIVSNSIDNTAPSLKEYLIYAYQNLSLSQKWNLILPEQYTTTVSNEVPNKTIYNNLIKKQYLRQEPWIYKAITYIIQQKNPVYYIAQLVEYSLNFIEKITAILWL